MTYCKVSQAEIYYEDIGEGIPIIMLHGYSLDHRIMSGCMEPIFTKMKGFRRIYIDLPGMGLSKNYNNINGSDDMLNAVQEFIEATIPNQKYLIAGESFGGYLARGMIEKWSDQIIGAAFICPLIYPLEENRLIEEHQVLKIDRKFVETLSNEELVDFKMNNVVLNEYAWMRYDNEILSGYQIGDENFLKKFKEQYALSFDIDTTKFKKPSVFLLGRQDSSVGFKDAMSIIDMYPRATYAVLDLAGHNLQIEQPRLFNNLIEEWLNRVEQTFEK